MAPGTDTGKSHRVPQNSAGFLSPTPQLITLYNETSLTFKGQSSLSKSPAPVGLWRRSCLRPPH